MTPCFSKASRALLLLFMPIAALMLGILPAAAQEWAINKDLSRLTFEGKAGGQAVLGEFRQFRADIRFDPEQLEITEISAAVDTNTIITGQPQVDDALVSKQWFDAQTYPTAGFRGVSIQAGETDGSFLLQANLTIKGNTKPVILPFSLEIDEGEATVSAETIVDRRDFGLGPADPVSGIAIDDMVKIRLDLVATRLDN